MTHVPDIGFLERETPTAVLAGWLVFMGYDIDPATGHFFNEFARRTYDGLAHALVALSPKKGG